MSIIISGKGGFNRLSFFKKKDFDSYELYLKIFDKKTIKKEIESLPNYINITSIHNPSYIRINNKFHKFDLTQKGIIEQESLKSLKNTITLAENINAKVIVIHGASYDYFSENKNKAIKRLAEKVKPLLTNKKLKITFETDAYWFNLAFSRHALLTHKEDFILLEKHLDQKASICPDIEHLQLSFYLTEFVNNLGGKEKFYKIFSENDYASFDNKVIPFINQNYPQLKEKFHEFLKNFFETFNSQIEHLHINGSDCLNFKFNKNTPSGLPLIGEHLPIGFEEKSTSISDKLNHQFLFSHLFNKLPKEKDILLVIEAWRNDINEFIISYRESKKILEKYNS